MDPSIVKNRAFLNVKDLFIVELRICEDAGFAYIFVVDDVGGLAVAVAVTKHLELLTFI